MKTKTYNFRCLIASVLTLLLMNSSSAATPPNSNSSTSCNRTCGGISIPFPFGIGGKDCYLNNWYEVVCNSNSGSDRNAPFLSRINMEVVNISLPVFNPYGLVQIKGPVTSLGCSSNSSQELKKSATRFECHKQRQSIFYNRREPLHGDWLQYQGIDDGYRIGNFGL